MRYKIELVLLAVVAAMSLACGARAAETGLKEISEGGITVSYPEKMQAPAKRVLAIAVKSIQPSVEIHRQIAALLADPAATAKTITELLGADECTQVTEDRLQAYRDKSQTLVQCFTHIRLVDKASAVSTGGVDAGLMQVRYDKDSGEFRMGLVEGAPADGALARSYFPIFVNADGTIRQENKLAEKALDFLGSSRAMVVAPVHETVNNILTEQLKLYHPFTRWFVEGVSGWVTKRVLLKADPKLSALLAEMFDVSAASSKLKGRINLLAWPQSAFQNRSKTHFDPEMEAADTQYSIEAMGKLLAGNRGGMLAKIMGEVKYVGNPDTDAVCAAAKKVAAVDFKKILLEYVPADVKLGMANGSSKKLAAQAEKLVQDKKWKEAGDKLRSALQMTPDDVNSRLNLAWIERETGERLDSEIQVFVTASLLRQKEYPFHLYAGSIEGNYILGRLAMLVGNISQAKEFLQPVLIAKPDHADARRAMEEIKRMESLTSGS